MNGLSTKDRTIPVITYTCAMCGEVCDSERDNEDAVKELQRDFGNVPTEDCVVVCDDCYQGVRPDRNPTRHEQWRREHEYREPRRKTLILFSGSKTFRVDIPDMQDSDLPPMGTVCAGYVIYPRKVISAGSLYQDDARQQLSYTNEQA